MLGVILIYFYNRGVIQRVENVQYCASVIIYSVYRETMEYWIQQDKVNHANSAFILINLLISRGCHSGSIGQGGLGGPIGSGGPDGPGGPGGTGGTGGTGGPGGPGGPGCPGGPGGPVFWIESETAKRGWERSSNGQQQTVGFPVNKEVSKSKITCSLMKWCLVSLLLWFELTWSINCLLQKHQHKTDHVLIKHPK